MGVICGRGTANPIRGPEFTPDFSGFVLLNLSFLCFVDPGMSKKLHG